MANGTPTVAQRLAALDALPRRAPPASRAILCALEDEAAAVRERAIRLAARYVEPGVLGAMVADGADAVRRNAALAALECQGPYALPHLTGHARAWPTRSGDVRAPDPGPDRRSGGGPLGPAPDPAPEPNIAQSAIEALGRLRSREAVPALLTLLGGELWLQLAAIDALGAIGDPEAVGPLIELVPDSIMAEPAVLALQRLADPDSLEPDAGAFPSGARAEPPGCAAARDRRGARSARRSRAGHPCLGGGAAARSDRRGRQLPAAGAHGSSSGDDLDAEERFRAAAALVARRRHRAPGADPPGPARRARCARIGPKRCSGHGRRRCGRSWTGTWPTPTPGCGAEPWWRCCLSRRTRRACCRCSRTRRSRCGPRRAAPWRLTGSSEASARLIPLLRDGSRWSRPPPRWTASRAARMAARPRWPRRLRPARSEDEMIAALGVFGVRAYPPLEERILQLVGQPEHAASAGRSPRGGALARLPGRSGSAPRSGRPEPAGAAGGARATGPPGRRPHGGDAHGPARHRRLAPVSRDPRARALQAAAGGGSAAPTLSDLAAARAAGDHRGAHPDRRGRAGGVPSRAADGGRRRDAADRRAGSGRPGRPGRAAATFCRLAPRPRLGHPERSGPRPAPGAAPATAARRCSPWRATSSRWWRATARQSLDQLAGRSEPARQVRRTA